MADTQAPGTCWHCEPIRQRHGLPHKSCVASASQARHVPADLRLSATVSFFPFALPPLRWRFRDMDFPDPIIVLLEFALNVRLPPPKLVESPGALPAPSSRARLLALTAASSPAVRRRLLIFFPAQVAGKSHAQALWPALAQSLLVSASRASTCCCRTWCLLKSCAVHTSHSCSHGKEAEWQKSEAACSMCVTSFVFASHEWCCGSVVQAGGRAATSRMEVDFTTTTMQEVEFLVREESRCSTARRAPTSTAVLFHPD